MSGSASYHWASPSVYELLQTFPLPTIPSLSFASNKCKLSLLLRSIGADTKCFILLNFYLNCCQRLALYLNNSFDHGEHFQTKWSLVKVSSSSKCKWYNMQRCQIICPGKLWIFYLQYLHVTSSIGSSLRTEWVVGTTQTPL